MLTTPLDKAPRSHHLFWFCLSLTCAAVLALWAANVAFTGEFVVQDDVRQHVFWMRRFVDRDLLPNDLLANYFQSVAPLGYTTVYRVLAAVGIDPLLSSKLLPIVLMLLTTAFCFGTCLQILPVPLAGFIASLLLNQNLIMADDLNSATPRAFLYPLFLAFLYFFLRRSLIPCAAAIGLLGLFYPQVMFLACGVLLLSLLRWERWPRLNASREQRIFCGVGLGVAAIVLLVYVLGGGSEFGPAIKASEARLMPEFWGKGRGSFFSHNPFDFWLFGSRSGFLPHPDQLLKPPLLLTGLLLPLLLHHPMRFPLAERVTEKARVLWLTVLASGGLFFLAHGLLFRLHHPSRYTQHSFRIVLALAAGVVLTIGIDALLRSARRAAAIGLVTVLAIVLLVYPTTARFAQLPGLEWILPNRMLPGYVTGSAPALYRFLAQQPKDSLIASLITEADNLPTFARRSILVGREYGIPYHKGYYRQFRERAIDLVRAQYSPDQAEVRRFTQKYGIRFWLINDSVFTPAFVMGKDWLQQYRPVTTEAAATLRQGVVPVVQRSRDRCTVFQSDNMAVLDAACVSAAPSPLIRSRFIR